MKAVFGLIKNKYVLSLISNGTNSLIGMLTLATLLRALTLHDMGEWGMFLTILLFFDTIRSGFLSTAFIKFYAGTSYQRGQEVAGSSWFIAASITGIFLLLNIPAYYIGKNLITDTGLLLFIKFFGLNYLLSLPYFMANCVLLGKQRFDLLLILNFTNQGSFLVLVLLVMNLMPLTLVMVVYCYLAANLLSSLLALCCNWTMIGQLGKKSRATVTEMFHFGKYNMGTNITGNLAGLISTFIVKFYLGSAALAIYNAGTKLLQVVELPLRSVVYTAAPSIASSFNEDNKAAVMHKMKKNAGLLTLALVPVCLLTIIFADFAILVLGGSKYVDTEAPNILRLFMAVSLFFPIERFFSLTLDVIHMPKINFLKIILFFVVTVIGYYLAATLSGSLYALTVSYYITICTSVTIGYVAINRYYARFGFSDIFAEGIRGAGEIIRNLKIRFRIS